MQSLPLVYQTSILLSNQRKIARVKFNGSERKIRWNSKFLRWPSATVLLLISDTFHADGNTQTCEIFSVDLSIVGRLSMITDFVMQWDQGCCFLNVLLHHKYPRQIVRKTIFSERSISLHLWYASYLRLFKNFYPPLVYIIQFNPPSPADLPDATWIPLIKFHLFHLNFTIASKLIWYHIPG